MAKALEKYKLDGIANSNLKNESLDIRIHEDDKLVDPIKANTESLKKPKRKHSNAK